MWPKRRQKEHTTRKKKKKGRAEGRRPGLGIRFGEGSLRYFSGQGRIQTMWLKEASQSIITDLINHRANVVGEIDACVVIKAQTSQQRGDHTQTVTTSSL